MTIPLIVLSEMKNSMSSSFAQLGVPESIFKSLARKGIVDPFEIQTAIIPDALAGQDICGRAPTGSGKTIAYGIPLVANVRRAKPKAPLALILVPTRELAEQISQEIRSFSGKVRVGVVYGGVGYGNQFRVLKEGLEILVACPGRLEDLLNQNAVRLSSVEYVVLDEADRMADMGFMPAVRRILGKTPSKRQTMLFSATLDGDVATLTKDYQKNPVDYQVDEDTLDITPATHIFWNVAKETRVSVTAEAVGAVWPSIVFCRTRRGSDRLANQLSHAGLQVAVIHGGRSQNQRTRALSDFAKNKTQALIASDVASRGIHVQDVASVIHFDPPEDHKAYVHRSGRTARAGKGGVVLSLVQSDQINSLRKIQRMVGLDQKFTAPDIANLHLIARSQASTSSFHFKSKSQTDKPLFGSKPDQKTLIKSNGRNHRPEIHGRSGIRRRFNSNGSGTAGLTKKHSTSDQRGKSRHMSRSSPKKRNSSGRI